MVALVLVLLLGASCVAFNPQGRNTPAAAVYDDSTRGRRYKPTDQVISFDRLDKQSPIKGKYQAYEVLAGSAKPNDYAYQAIYTLLSCHGGLDLADGVKLASGAQLGEEAKYIDAELLYDCEVNDDDNDEFHAKEWYELLDHSIRLGYSRFSIKIFYKMKRLGLNINTHTITELLKCACAEGHYDEALAVFDTSISYGMEPTVHNFSPLLKSCGSVGKARELLQRMEHCGISPNVISYTAAIKSCEPSGNLESVLAIMELMRACGVQPNEVTYCCVISVASKGMQGTLAVNMLREMEINGLPPNQLCYGSALTACARSNMWKEVGVLLHEMEARGLPLQESVLISVINVCRISQLRAIEEGTAAAAATGGDTPSVGATTISSETAADSYLWRHAVGLALKWGNKVQNATESVYTMAMDVCETAGKNKEIVNLFRIMLSRRVKASKSSYLFALRACARDQSIKEAVMVLNEAENMGMDAPFMYNSTLMLCESLGRFDVAVGIMRQMMHAPDTSSSSGGGAGSKVPSPLATATATATASQLYHGANSMNKNNKTAAAASSFVSFHTSLKHSKWRNSVLWTARRIISKALTSLTRGFNSIFTEVHDGRLRPNAANARFVSDLTALLCDSIHERYGGLRLTPGNQPRFNSGYLLPSCYPMANKLLLDSGDYSALRVLLNSTLYSQGSSTGGSGSSYGGNSISNSYVNSTRLYEFAIKSLIPFMTLGSSGSSKGGSRGRSSDGGQSLRKSVEVVASLISDVREAGQTELACSLLLKGTSRLRLVPSQAASSASGNSNGNNKGGREEHRTLRDRDFLDAPASPVSPQIIRDLYHTDHDHLSADEAIVKSRLRLVCFLALAVRKRSGPGTLTPHVYHIAALAAKQTHSHSLMLEICRLAREDGLLDSTVQQYGLSCLAKSGEHWHYALELFEMLRTASAKARTTFNTTTTATSSSGGGNVSVEGGLVDRYTFSYALTACEHGKQWRRALELLSEMSRDGVQPNAVLISQTIAVCSAAGEVDEAMKLFRAVQQQQDGGHPLYPGVRPTTLTYCKVIQALQSHGRWREALEVYELGVQEGDSAACGDVVTQAAAVSVAADDGSEKEVPFFQPRDGSGSMDAVWLHRALLECLATAGQTLLVDEIYRRALLEQESTPLRPFRRLQVDSTVDLHHHSVHMAQSAMRCCFSDMLSDYDSWLLYLRGRGSAAGGTRSEITSEGKGDSEGSETDGDSRRPRRLPAVLRRGGGKDYRGQKSYLAVVVGKGSKLRQALVAQLSAEFNPPLRVLDHPTNQGRLIIPKNEALAWLRAHSSVYQQQSRSNSSKRAFSTRRASKQSTGSTSSSSDRSSSSSGSGRERRMRQLPRAFSGYSEESLS
jgi:pentatricopeptide repeat protein